MSHIPPPDNIATPALVIDLPTVERNIARMAAYVKQHNLGLRPHTKTHKSVLMSRKQLQAGSIGLTVAKVGEADVMTQAGRDILLAYPALDPARTGRIAELAKENTIRVAVDSIFAAERIGEAAAKAGVTVGILVDIDTGFHRTGVQSPQEALEIAQAVSKTRGLRLDGLFTFPGHVSGTTENRQKGLAVVQGILAATHDLWKQHGLEAKIISGGSTPTAMLSHEVPAYTEIRPGTYIYSDRNCIEGYCSEQADCAAVIVATVVSNAVPGKCVIDAGNKTLTSDLCLGVKERGHGLIVEYPQAKISRLSEEHGEVDLSQCDKRPKLGERVQVIMNHICPCVNLQEAAWLRDAGGALERLPVDARGRLS